MVADFRRFSTQDQPPAIFLDNKANRGLYLALTAGNIIVALTDADIVHPFIGWLVGGIPTPCEPSRGDLLYSDGGQAGGAQGIFGAAGRCTDGNTVQSERGKT